MTCSHRNAHPQDCDNGLSERKAAIKWKIGRSTISKLKRLRRDTGCIEPCKGVKSVVAKELIESRGALLLPLPAYSPDLNPIENAFAKLKSRLRKETP